MIIAVASGKGGTGKTTVVTEARVQGERILEYTDGTVVQEIRNILGNLQEAVSG